MGDPDIVDYLFGSFFIVLTSGVLGVLMAMTTFIFFRSPKNNDEAKTLAGAAVSFPVLASFCILVGWFSHDVLCGMEGFTVYLLKTSPVVVVCFLSTVLTRTLFERNQRNLNSLDGPCG